MPRPKRVEKTKEQLAHEHKVRQAQTLIQERVFPALVSATTSVDESKMLLKAITTSFMEEAMSVLRERKVSDIRASLIKKLCSEGRDKEVGALLDTMADQSLFDARNLLEGLNAGVEQMILDEMRSRTLNSMEVDWNRIFQR